MNSVLPWPIYGLIIEYANSWRLRAVCKKFLAFSDKLFKFNYSDLAAIASKGTPTVLLAYLNQHDYASYNVKFDRVVFHSIEVLEILIKRDADMVTNMVRATCVAGYLPLIKYFLEKIPEDANYVYFSTFCGGKQPAVEYLMSLPIFVKNRVSAINGSCKRGNYELFKKVYAGTVTNSSLYYSCRGGNLNIIKRLIADGASGKDNGFCGACRGGHLDAVKYILSIGDVNIKHGLIEACKKGHMNIVEYLIGYFLPNKDQFFPFACTSGNLELVKYFMLNAPRTNHALLNACASSHVEVVKYLLENGYNLTDDCLVAACRHGRLEMVVAVLQYLSPSKNAIEAACSNYHYHISALFIGHECALCETLSYSDKCPVGRFRF